MIEKETLEKYAELALKTGVNLQKGQALMINSTIEGADFTKIVVRKAYELGAKDVLINWSDDELTLLKYQYAPEDRKSTRLNSSHVAISYAVFCLKKKRRWKVCPNAWIICPSKTSTMT